jgi:hypothetical protein
MSSPRHASATPGSGATAGPPGGLSPLELQGLRIVGKDATRWRDAVEPGHGQRVAVLVLIELTVDVDPDGFRSAKELPTPAELLAYIYSLLPDKLRQAVHRGLFKSFHNGQRPTVDQQHQNLAQLALERITTREQKPVKGAVRGRELRILKLPRKLAEYKAAKR